MTKAEASQALAEYVRDNNNEHNDYDQHVEDGNDPREHVLYWSAVILGKTSYLQKELKDHKRKEARLKHEKSKKAS